MINRFFITLILLAGAALPALAQEIQIPFDREGRIEIFTADLERKLRLFPDIADFSEARLYRLSDTLYSLEIISLDRGKTYRTRRELTQNEFNDFRNLVSNRMRLRAPEALMDQEGRTAFITGATLLSFGFYGWSMPTALNIENEKTIAATYLLTGGFGFLFPYLATEHARVTEGTASLALQGGVRGIVDGLLVYWFLRGDKDRYERESLSWATGLSISELCIGYYLADKYNLSVGKTSVLATCGNFGLGIGLGAYFLAANNNSPDIRLAPVLGLTGSGLGYLVGNWMANEQNYTGGDASILTTCGLLGAGVPTALMSLTDSEDEKLYIGSAVVGSIVGLGAGHLLLEDKDFTVSQASFIGLGTLAGGVFGLGIAVLMSDDDNAKLPLTLGSLGALAGFGVMYSAYEREARIAAKSTSWNFQISPLGLAASLLPAKRAGSHPLPLVNMRVSF